MATGDVKWRDGKAAVYVFNAGEDIDQVQKEAYAMFASENGLGPAAFPQSGRHGEALYVGFGLGLLHAPEGAAGAMTSGGTDSILMAVKAARDYARKERGLTGQLNIVLPRSAHPAFDKACAGDGDRGPPHAAEGLPGRSSGHRGGGRRRDHDDRRLGPLLSLRPDRPHRGPRRRWPSGVACGCTWTPASAATSPPSCG
jgi:hypothetical protein